MEKEKFELELYESYATVRVHIRECEGKHIQQVVYSTYHDALTQICFDCKKIRTSMKKEALQKQNSSNHIPSSPLLEEN